MGSILAETVRNQTLTHLYIAAPFDDADLISRIISAIPKQIKVFYGEDMEKPGILLFKISPFCAIFETCAKIELRHPKKSMLGKNMKIVQQS